MSDTTDRFPRPSAAAEQQNGQARPNALAPPRQPGPDERARLAVLEFYELMDTPPEPEFDRITSLAARLFATPLALICLLGDGRFHLKSIHGAPQGDTPACDHFCRAAMAESDVLVVPDATLDPRFAGLRAVCGPAHVRFYAGVPLRVGDGHALGTLAVIGRQPRPAPGPTELAVLRDLAATVVSLFDARLRERQLAQASTAARLRADLLRLSFEASDWSTMMRAVLSRLASATGAAAGAVCRLYPDGRVGVAEYHLEAADLPEDLVEACSRARPQAGETLVGQAMIEDRPIACELREEDLAGRPILALAYQAGLHAILVQPVRLVRERFALALLFRSTPSSFYRFQRNLTELVDTLRPALFRHEAERRQELLGAGLDAASDAIIIAEAAARPGDEPRVIYASAAVSRITGWQPEEIIGARPGLFFAPGNDPRLLARMRAAVRSGRPLREEMLGVRKDGSTLWVESVITTLHDATGKPTHHIAIQRDVTQRRSDAAREEDINRAFRLMFEENPAAICIFEEPSLRVLEANAAMLRQYGYSREELLAMTVGGFQPPTERATAPEDIFRRGPGYHHTGALRNVRRNGEEIWVQVASQPMIFHGKRARIAVIADITAMHTAQQAMLQAERLSTIGQITGGIAHDFNNLLTVILLNLGDALELAAPGSEQAGMIDSALYAATRGAELTSHLLSYARRQALRPQRFTLRERLARVLPLLQRAVGERHRLETDFLTPDMQVNADPAQFEIAVMNLVLNARDAMGEGGVIRIGTARQRFDAVAPAVPDAIGAGEYAAVRVVDTGQGIAPENLHRVFEPFFTTKAAGQGSGLGLSMVYGFARQSGGHVRLESTRGSGTCIELLLPESVSRPMPVSEGKTASFSGSGLTTLLVEDQAPVLAAISRRFGGLGFRVLTATNAAEAEKVLAEEPRIDLLFTDVVLPGAIDGAALARRAQASHPGLRVLLTSGYSGEGLRPADFPLLAKPYLLRDLLAALADCFERSG